MPVTPTAPVLEANDDRPRRRARACVPPLALLTVVFVLPTVRSCDTVDSPLSYGLHGPVFAAMAWPLFLIAAALAITTLLQPKTGPFSPPTRGVQAAPILTWLTSAWPMFILVDEAIGKNRTGPAIAVPGLALAIALPLSIASFRRALRAAGWTRSWHALGSFAAAAWLTFPAQWVSMCVLDRGRGLEPGAYVLLVAMVWLSAAAARRR